MTNVKKVIFTTIFAIGIGSAKLSQAALYDRGGGLIYDDTQDITWLQDANYAKTTGLNIYGELNWYAAQNWVSNLVYHDNVRNVIYSDWRLPTAYANVDITRYSQSGSELSTLFYMLGGEAGKPIATNHNYNFNLFGNIQQVYWLGTEFTRIPGFAWYFDESVGYHELNSESYVSFAWAVRDGDVAAVNVPEPSIIWLFLTGFGLLAFNRGSKGKSVTSFPTVPISASGENPNRPPTANTPLPQTPEQSPPLP
ncbi:PEP-CTERM sorting domain-containing protein [Methylomonas montana]|uniref:Lcl domain-containing protein n=1 Tax=Methylomonas montana TaxID=3058963 RepID=UPI00265ACAEC|nr:PEP-CTERM sorting domain-containing protein [Methylomonas montana]WKJ91366.1 PEP-CTERM sorting domain-containing protein [Methylomonas montana]